MSLIKFTKENIVRDLMNPAYRLEGVKTSKAFYSGIALPSFLLFTRRQQLNIFNSARAINPESEHDLVARCFNDPRVPLGKSTKAHILTFLSQWNVPEVRSRGLYALRYLALDMQAAYASTAATEPGRAGLLQHRRDVSVDQFYWTSLLFAYIFILLRNTEWRATRFEALHDIIFPRLRHTVIYRDEVAVPTP